MTTEQPNAISAHPGNAAAEDALSIYVAALAAVRADHLILSTLRREGDILQVGDLSLPLADFERVYLVGAGKAAAMMAAAAEQKLAGFLTKGVVVTKYGHRVPTQQVHVLEAGHPVPDAASLEAGRVIHALVSQAGERDLVICLISGGASALMELPHESVTLNDLRMTTDLLLKAGAGVEELNTVRACLSKLKAGGLARAAYPARVVCLLLSDVLGNPLGIIGSGPCVEIPVDPAAAKEVLLQYGLWEAVSEAVRELLTTPLIPLASWGDSEHSRRLQEGWGGSRVDHILLGDIWTAIRAAREAALARGLRPCVLTGYLTGEAREVARIFGGIARDLPQTAPLNGINCYIAGGETTVTVRGEGRGGRSQEIACAAAALLDGVEGVALLAAGTDGTDGPTDAAGGLVDGETLNRAKAAGASLEAALAQSDSYTFLQAAQALVITGPTQSNVGDLIVVVHRIGESGENSRNPLCAGTGS
jgi:glycerate 2-kinase